MCVQILPLKSFDEAKDKVTLKNMLVGHQHSLTIKKMDLLLLIIPGLFK